MRVVIALTLFLAACAAPPPADYAQPSHAEAMAAMRAGNAADAAILRARIASDPAEGSWGRLDDEIEADTLADPEFVKALTVEQCEWVWIEKGELAESSRTRIGEEPRGAYRCDTRASYDALGMGTITHTLPGYWYRDPAAGWVFAEIG